MNRKKCILLWFLKIFFCYLIDVLFFNVWCKSTQFITRAKKNASWCIIKMSTVWIVILIKKKKKIDKNPRKNLLIYKIILHYYVLKIFLHSNSAILWQNFCNMEIYPRPQILTKYIVSYRIVTKTIIISLSLFHSMEK